MSLKASAVPCTTLSFTLFQHIVFFPPARGCKKNHLKAIYKKKAYEEEEGEEAHVKTYCTWQKKTHFLILILEPRDAGGSSPIIL